jgi:hypothetical protein
MKSAPSSVSLPQIRIKNAWLLRDNVSKHLHILWAKEGEPLADDSWIDNKVADYQKAWKPVEEQILTSLTDILGLSFRQNIIDVYIAPWFNAFSDPLVIGVTKDPDVFIDLLTHELIHRLLTDNNETPYSKRHLKVWGELFGEGISKSALVHIPVHALMKAIFIDVLHEPERLERDIASCREQNAVDYTTAWEYVEKHDYKEIIEKLKKTYSI